MQMATKQDQQTTPEHQSSKKKRSWKSLLLKAAFTGFCMLFFYSAYLDWQIRNKMDGQIWRLPAEVYSRIESIRLSDELSLEQIKQILLDNEYRQTTMIAAPGDFKIEDKELLDYLVTSWKYRDIVGHSTMMYQIERDKKGA